MAGKFKKDVLVMDWHYRAEVDAESLDFLTGAGFEVWAAPATMWWYVRLLSGPGAMRNVREFVGHACQPQRPRVTGAVNTTWCSWRHLPGALDWPVAWAGHVMSSKVEEEEGFCREFCRTFYGLGRDEAAGAAAALLALYGLAPDTPRVDAVMNGGVACTRERVRECRAMLPGVRGAVRELEKALSRARRHGERLRDVVLSGRLLERWAMLGAEGRGRMARGAGEKLAAACEERWAVERPYPTPVFAAAGKWQHVLQLARGLV